VAADGTLQAVLDFGDVTAGDPAVDLATAWLTFDDAGRRSFRDLVTRLCGTDRDTWQRARGWALVLAVAFLAHSDDDPPFATLGANALAQVLAD
jgi:aminoglycoside phosphotransferase (APT) family kinase protein